MSRRYAKMAATRISRAENHLRRHGSVCCLSLIVGSVVPRCGPSGLSWHKKRHQYFTFCTIDWFIGLVMVDMENVCCNVTPDSPIWNNRENNKNHITVGGGCMKSVGQEMEIGKNVPGRRDTEHFSCNFQRCCVEWSWNVLPTNRRDWDKGGLRREEGRKGGRVWGDKWRESSPGLSIL